ncbi:MULTISPECIES: type II toxin-antitoxin system prevent-host-death family antitoxin [Agrobacterium]|uniref:type II toxin-antitoxin system prevent-host-death family antitoxin n=1 Tax=Agrobacterium TaxID=357 RepID=UPI002300F8DF|nr:MULTISPECIES: type II toxin-antitoxin system prevent-host-death family antitoxin [Agrobacterium]MDA5639593.1 type II toxin-antitoxin system prevent-host-death family antitoxin [Agrobacterium sp. ST15.13.013]MDA6999512.1 type II toxin-antitoxin system prevent-host-death family antitoxin [Agrobacterium salinitolerans]
MAQIIEHNSKIHVEKTPALERAQLAPQTITRNGKPSVVVVSTEEWHRKTGRRGSLAEFLLASPLRGADLDLERQHDEPGDLSL